MLLSDILSFFNTRHHAQYVCVCVIPCHRVSACWWGSPVAAVVSRRAERSLCELTHTAPRERKTKKEREKGIMRQGRERKRCCKQPNRKGKWWRGEMKEREKKQGSKSIKRQKHSHVFTQKHPFTRPRNTTCVKTIEAPPLMHTDLISLLCR